jgi:rifampicin phosphotransferase
VAEVGGKAWNLGRLIGIGARVLPCFAIPVSESRRFADFAHLDEVIYLKLEPKQVSAIVKERYQSYYPTYERLYSLLEAGFLAVPILRNSRLAVRSSASFEDMKAASNAGQHDTFLGVEGTQAAAEAVAMCWASQWTERAIIYRQSRGVAETGAAMAVVVQELAAADKAGVVFTKDPTRVVETLVIEATPGFGEALVSGRVIPERLLVNRKTGIVEERITRAGSTGECLSEAEIEALVQAALKIEIMLGEPQDIEWAFAGPKLYILQARPITAGIHTT